jgi:cellulose synthase/poly-beta-1,6-N-acetylglucosamine synthase-like glycosyltransferase
MIGILDADGRLHTDVLKEVAMKRMQNGAKLLQGPVFQVGNFNDVSIVGRAAGLELALHHLTELPAQLNRDNNLQFLAGTNYFIDTKCIVDAGGWDQHALVEDAEIALRLYTKSKIVGDWLNSPEIEQTPPNFAVYRKQRHRWVRGHIDLIKQIHDSALTKLEKTRLYNKIIFSQLRFIFDVGLPILSIYLMIAGAYSYIHPAFVYISIILFIASIGIWDTYGFMYRSLKQYIDPEMSVRQQASKSIAHLLFMPVFIIIQAIPRFTALFSYLFNKNQNTWYKTERTVEAVIN